MTREIGVVMRKELREVGLEGGGTGRFGRLTPFIGVIVAGIVLPLNLGVRFVTPAIMMGLGVILPLLFVLPIVADSFAGERERHTLETLLATRLPDRAILFGKLAAIVLFALGMSTLSLAIGFATVNIAHPEARPLLVSLRLIGGVLLEGILAATLIAALGLLISLGAATVRQAQQRVSMMILLPMLIPVFVTRTPESIRGPIRELFVSGRLTPMELVLGVLVAVDAVLLYLSMLRFRRSRLVLA
jgi:ABC-2 type transport system permease protein